VIDPLTETIVGLAELPKRLNLRRNGRPLSPVTVWRWATYGLRNVKLETIKLGGRRITSVEAFQRFIAATNGQPPPTQSTSNKEHQREIEAQLDQLGVGSRAEKGSKALE
jgi:hypothetical protein